MDIKTLPHNLRHEVSCLLCKNVYTDPKQLPCLHSFCLQCLKQWHTTSHGRDTIRCPKCQARSRAPDGGDLKDLPISFYLNGLIDVLAIKECKSSPVRCGNCDKKSSETSYCFQCCIFYCADCLTRGHNIIRSNKDHRVLALKDFQDKDHEDVLQRPSFCPKQGHEKEELKYFCENCEAAVCQSCVLMDHAGHALERIEEEAERQKIEIKSLIETQRRNLQAKMNTVGKLDEECAKLLQQGEDVKRDVQKFVDKLIATVEAKKQNIFAAVENGTNETLTTHKTEIERQMRLIESSVERADQVLSQSTNIDVVQLRQLLESIIVDDEPVDRDPNRPPAVVFLENENMLDAVRREDIGTLKIAHQTKRR